MAIRETMKGKTCLVTGGARGLGAAIVRQLAARGAEVLVADAEEGRGAAFLAALRRDLPGADATFLHVDMTSRRSVCALAAAVREHHVRSPRLDILVNNVEGAMLLARDRALTSTLLAPFLLSGLLGRTLQACAPSRVVNVATGLRRARTVALDDLQGERCFDEIAACARTSTGLVLFTHELAHRLDGTGVTVNAVHPDTGRLGLLTDVREILDTAVWLASSDDVEGRTGGHFVGREEMPVAAQTYGHTLRRRFWDACELAAQGAHDRRLSAEFAGARA
jgi:NAD(P)-dependent dehydrogenase (short-subunit alcohol dehydrogenase family)